MNTAIMKFLAAGLLGFSLVGAKAPAVNVASKADFAITASSGSSSQGIAGIGIAMPGKVVSVSGAPGIIKQPIANGDEIVQLNNLIVENISGNTITAQSNWVNPCIMGAQSNKSVKGNFAYPCLLAPVQIFKIQAGTDTILLLRNRTRATLADFAIGEHINVYGFQNQDNSVDALIVRDLDKPVLIQPVELNNMEITAINGSTLTVQFHISCKGEICPMMGAAANGINPSAKIMMPMMYPMPRNVVVGSDTKLTDRNGNAINFSDLKVGDMVNVKGTIKGVDFNTDVTANAVQDTSIPTIKSASLSIVSFSGPGKLQANQTGTWNIRITDANQDSISYSINWGDEAMGGIATPQMMEKDGDSFGGFTHAYSAPGNYTVTITVTDASGKTATATSNVYVF